MKLKTSTANHETASKFKHICSILFSSIQLKFSGMTFNTLFTILYLNSTEQTLYAIYIGISFSLNLNGWVKYSEQYNLYDLCNCSNKDILSHYPIFPYAAFQFKIHIWIYHSCDWLFLSLFLSIFFFFFLIEDKSF